MTAHALTERGGEINCAARVRPAHATHSSDKRQTAGRGLEWGAPRLARLRNVSLYPRFLLVATRS